MNKRQAKKAFKKKYGMTPKQAQQLFDKVYNEAAPTLIQHLCDGINDIFKQLSDALPDIIESINSVFAQLGERLQDPEFVEALKQQQQDTEE